MWSTEMKFLPLETLRPYTLSYNFPSLRLSFSFDSDELIKTEIRSGLQSSFFLSLLSVSTVLVGSSGMYMSLIQRYPTRLLTTV